MDDHAAGSAEPVVIATLGPKGAYSVTAAESYMRRRAQGRDHSFIFAPVVKCLALVAERQADLAVVPIENSVDGIIGSTLDALVDYHDFVKVCDQVAVGVRHVLATATRETSLDRISRVYSHFSALNQCTETLSRLLPTAELVSVGSTAEAAALVSSGPNRPWAAVCSPEAVVEYGLTVLVKEVQDYAHNVTRFAVCASTDGERTGRDRTLIAVRYGVDRPGQLFELTREFAERGVNLTFVQSRPFKFRPDEYVLIFEAKAHRLDPCLASALVVIDRLVRETGGWKRVLGSYPEAGEATRAGGDEG